MPKLRDDEGARPPELTEPVGLAEPLGGKGRAARPPGRLWRWGLMLALLMVGAGGGWLFAPRSSNTTNGAGTAPATFAEVVRTDVRQRTDLPGGLSYMADHSVINRLAGLGREATLTGVAAQGTVVRRGGRLFSVDMRPVVLMLGPVPAWRPLELGVVGADVRELERNLKVLGYRGFTVNGIFTSATWAAVRQWEQDIGTPADGVVDLGEVVFLPTAARIDQRLLTPGDAVSPGARVLAVGAPGPVVTVSLEPTQLSLVSAGDRVIVRLADGRQTPATVVSVGENSNGVGDQQGGKTVPATVSLIRPADAAGLAGSSATVSVVTSTSKNVLAVPVTALLAVPGGYVVDVRRRDRIQALSVTPGLFDGVTNLVEIRATGLDPGDSVVVAEAGA